MNRPPLPRSGAARVRAIGIDPAMNSTGVAWSGGISLLEPPKQAGSGMARLAWIRDAIGSVLRLARPHVVVMEGPSLGQKRGSSQTWSLGMFGGVLRLAIWDSGVPVVEVAPGTLKVYATGTGKGGKEGVYAEAIRRFGYNGSSFDEADALILYAMAMDAFGSPIVELPQTHRRALDSVTWPDLNLQPAQGR